MLVISNVQKDPAGGDLCMVIMEDISDEVTRIWCKRLNSH